jgi:hypothetical protein
MQLSANSAFNRWRWKNASGRATNLVVPQRDDGIDARGATRGNDASERC